MCTCTVHVSMLACTFDGGLDKDGWEQSHRMTDILFYTLYVSLNALLCFSFPPSRQLHSILMSLAFFPSVFSSYSSENHRNLLCSDIMTTHHPRVSFHFLFISYSLCSRNLTVFPHCILEFDHFWCPEKNEHATFLFLLKMLVFL